MKQPIIKWSGSKRYIAKEIVSYFNKKINTFYEPFIGGGSILFYLLQDKTINCKNYIVSDINNDLVSLWNIILDKPEYIKKNYRKYWEEFNSIHNIDLRKEYYYKIRREFNISRDTAKFMFLDRTCIAGLIRYNSKNEFNSPLHLTRCGINPKTFDKILEYWYNILKINNVKFINQSYENIKTSNKDVLYLDPPYSYTKGMYYGKIDYNNFFNWIKTQNAQILLSFDGITSKKNYFDSNKIIPRNLFDRHIFCSKSKGGGFHVLHNNHVELQESLYIKKDKNPFKFKKSLLDFLKENTKK